jgi:hypothetical protein
MRFLMRLLLATTLVLALVSCDRLLQQLPADDAAPPGEPAPSPAILSAPPTPTTHPIPTELHGEPSATPFEPTPEIPPPIY